MQTIRANVFINRWPIAFCTSRDCRGGGHFKRFQFNLKLLLGLNISPIKLVAIISSLRKPFKDLKQLVKSLLLQQYAHQNVIKY